MDVVILHEDQDIVVINKPAGIVVNRSETNKDETLQDWMVERLLDDDKLNPEEALIPADFDPTYGQPQEIFKDRQGLVHRLDKDTSGVMVWAKNPGALVNLLSQFKNRLTQKKYICLAHGKFRVPEGTIQAPLGRSSNDRQKFAIQATGRQAETDYRIEEFYPDFKSEAITELFPDKRRLSLYQGFSLVNCWPKTGRTHQIRVHLKHWRHPLVGDSKYTGKKRAKLDALWCPRQFLHAAELELTHPRTQEKMTFTADLTPDLAQVLTYLRSSD